MKAPSVIVIDFETAGIEGRPKYPPAPVGVSIRWPKDRKSKYYAWGHPTGNNCDKAEAKRRLKEAYASGLPLLFHHSKFDLDVAEVHMDCPLPRWELIEDTLFLAFLDNPHAPSFQLKPMAERLLNLPPEERDAVRDWLIEAGIVRKDDRKWGAHICDAPGTLVGKYAEGDTDRTLKLFQYFYPRVMDAGMKEAYDRERHAMPILLQNEREGMRVDTKALRDDITSYTANLATADAWLRKRLKTPELNIDSDRELANALEREGVVTEFEMTEKGNRSTSKKTMTAEKFHDQKVFAVLGYRNRLSTCLGTFMRPWLETAEQSKGLIFTNWNQVRQNHGASDATNGARTGRLSSNPNFQNIPKNFYDKDDGYVHPGFIKTISELPLVRRYVLPDKGDYFVHRDYSQQEYRILAHFEDDRLLSEYRSNPELDIHEFVGGAIESVIGRHLERRVVKTTNFGILYGMGLGTLAERLHISYDEAKSIKSAHRKGMPSIADLEKQIKKIGSSGDPIRTWGGRLYYCEPPKLVGNFERTYEYKLLNYLIQGSAADCTKQALINYSEVRKDGRFLVTVHDEINISSPKGAYKGEMKRLKEAMAAVEFDVPMLSDGKYGPTWGALTKYKED